MHDTLTTPKRTFQRVAYYRSLCTLDKKISETIFTFTFTSNLKVLESEAQKPG